MITPNFKLNLTKYLLLLFLLSPIIQSQPACYVLCGKNTCLSTNSLSCTECDVGSLLINQRCISIGSQSEPIQFINPLSQTLLNLSLFLNSTTHQQIQCGYFSNDQTGILTFVNVTVTQNLIYTFRLPLIYIKSTHQYITLKLNAVLFNPNKINPAFRILVIDQTNKHIIDSQFTPNQNSFQCNINNQLQQQIPTFYINTSVSSQSQQLLISISTLQPGDQLGISSINIYYGNCFPGCDTCSGPGSTQCLSCHNLLSYIPTLKSCMNCPPKFYQINQICYPCPYQCSSCTYNQTSGLPSCTTCQTSISTGTPPDCFINNFVITQFNTTKFTNSDDWSSTAVLTNLTTSCGVYSLVGGLPVGLGGSTLSKTFTNLPVHQTLWIKFTLMMIDQVTGSTFTVYVNIDGTQVLNLTINIDSAVMNTNQCGTSRQQFIQSILINNITHSKSNLTIQILGLGNYYGIRDFSLGIVNLTSLITCDQVNSQGQCVRCKNGFLLVNPPPTNNQSATLPPCSVCPNGYFNVSDICKPCSIYCRTCTQDSSYTKCTSCDPPLIFNNKTRTCNDPTGNLYSMILFPQQTPIDTSWSFYPKLQDKGLDTCGSYSILGSTTIQYRTLTITKNFYNLPSHTGVILHLFFYQIDDFNPATANNSYDTAYFKLNNLEIPYNTSNIGYNICGNDTYDSITKIILTDDFHTSSTLTFQIDGNGIKFGISNILLFLQNCLTCQGGISYQLQTIPQYSIENNPTPTTKGLKSKLIFSNGIQTTINPINLFQISLLNASQNSPSLQQSNNSTNFTTGQNDPNAILFAQIYQNRQLRLYQDLIRDQYNQIVIATVQNPDSIYTLNTKPQNAFQTLQLQPVYGTFSRYDNIYSILDTNPNPQGPQYQANIRNLMNLFRGVSILALFIGLISFLFGISEIFDDLFVLCQIIFAHIFIQSSWIPPSMKLPVGAMNIVQFMQWIPIQGRIAIQQSIIPANHYQRSPIVFEQYWIDISFVRAIYHTILFLAGMFALYWMIRLIQALRRPTINNIMLITQKKPNHIQNHYYNYMKHWFVFIDKIVRFSFFTVIWSASLQFIHFSCQPMQFMIWNSVICIFMFTVYVLYIGIGFGYLHSTGKIIQINTYRQKFGGIRIKRQRSWYFIFKYFKLLAIALLITQLYNQNPISILIPLIFIHILDAVILLILKPYLEDVGESQQIVSKCTRRYWIYYKYSHIIQNILFVIIQIIMLIMYGSRTLTNKFKYLSIGYACCAFIIFLFINGFIRLVWGFVRIFQLCLEDIKSKDQQIQSQDNIAPLKYMELKRANMNQSLYTAQRNYNRNPSIQIKVKQ